MDSLLPFLYILCLSCAFIAGVITLKARIGTREPAFPRVTVFMLLAIAIPTTLQFFLPALLTLFQRDAVKFLAGEWWRFFTPLFFQDGGVTGTIFNLVTLLLIGNIAGQLWDTKSWLLIFLLGGVFSEFVAFAWQPQGAGNSVANFSLAGSLAILSLVRNAPNPARIAALVALGCCAILLFLRDIHGAAGLIGSLIAVVLLRVKRSEATS